MTNLNYFICRKYCYTYYSYSKLSYYSSNAININSYNGVGNVLSLIFSWLVIFSIRYLLNMDLKSFVNSYLIYYKFINPNKALMSHKNSTDDLNNSMQIKKIIFKTSIQDNKDYIVFSDFKNFLMFEKNYIISSRGSYMLDCKFNNSVDEFIYNLYLL